jgi:DNA-binding response OmpR family regulator
MTVLPTHVLVIDDNEDILFMLKAMLQHKGYKVFIKENIVNLEANIREISPGVILMDMLLSGADGREVCRHLKSNPDLSAIPVVMLSAHPQARKECLAAGADYFLEKPFEMEALYEIVSNAANDILKTQ